MKKEKTIIQPLSDRVLIKEATTTETITKSGIILSSEHDDKGSKQGEVIAVGPGKDKKMEVKKGDTVLFSWGDKIKIDNEEYYIVRESELIAVIK